MELQQFITETITQIVHGTKNAQDNLKDDDVIINPTLHETDLQKINNIAWFQHRNVTIIDFDIALTTSETTATSGKAGLLVASFGLGGSIKQDDMNNVINRIKFSIPITLPFDRDKTKK